MNGPGQTCRRAIRAVAAGAALLLSALTPAHPASIERRSDGTLLVKAQGEHFVFSERDERLVPTDSVADKTEFFFNIAASRDNHVVYSGVFEPNFSGKHGVLLIEGVGFVVNKASQPGLPPTLRRTAIRSPPRSQLLSHQGDLGGPRR